MPVETAISIPTVIDRRPVGSFQLAIFLMLGVTVIMDGFDVQAMGFVAPAIIRDWGVNKAELGPVFGAGLTGMLVGSLTLSVVADRLGRRPVLIGATLFFAACMLATSRATSLPQLEWLRFFTGTGLGAIMPNAVALAGEYAPSRRRVTLMILVSCGLTLGAMAGGLVSTALIPRWGWASVFVVGGVVPLVAALLMLPFLPESLQFLALRGGSRARIERSLRRIDPDIELRPDTRFEIADASGQGTPFVDLLREGRARTTILLWAVNFLNLFNLYFLANWLPTIATDAGMSSSRALLLGTTLQAGGVIGSLALGPGIEAVGYRAILVPLYGITAGTIALIGLPGLVPAALFLVVLISGLGIIGSQPALNALAGGYYPTALRSTGVGWALGIGRIGAIVGPVLGGLLIGLHWSNPRLFATVAIAAALSAVLLLGIRDAPGIRHSDGSDEVNSEQ
ncbi:MAG TPA: MFS transporter [Gemmatimonadales bacterium]|nr:MFS transporter [Gemmatimonadales bacterium]